MIKPSNDILNSISVDQRFLLLGHCFNNPPLINVFTMFQIDEVSSSDKTFERHTKCNFGRPKVSVTFLGQCFNYPPPVLQVSNEMEWNGIWTYFSEIRRPWNNLDHFRPVWLSIIFSSHLTIIMMTWGRRNAIKRSSLIFQKLKSVLNFSFCPRNKFEKQLIFN